MAEIINLKAEAFRLSDEARELEAQALLVQKRASDWDEKITDYTRRSIAKIERDWNLQLADTYRRRAASLRRKAQRLFKRAAKKGHDIPNPPTSKGIFHE